MNKAYKVVFNKLRGTMMVVNEATSSIQKKGAKTFVAATIAVTCAGMLGVSTNVDAKAVGNYPNTGAELLALKTGTAQDRLTFNKLEAFVDGQDDEVIGGFYVKQNKTDSFKNATGTYEFFVKELSTEVQGGTWEESITGGNKVNVGFAYADVLRQPKVSFDTEKVTTVISGGTIGTSYTPDYGNNHNRLIIAGDALKDEGYNNNAVTAELSSKIGVTQLTVTGGVINTPIFGGSLADTWCWENTNMKAEVVQSNIIVQLEGGQTLATQIFAGGMAANLNNNGDGFWADPNNGFGDDREHQIVSNVDKGNIYLINSQTQADLYAGGLIVVNPPVSDDRPNRVAPVAEVGSTTISLDHSTADGVYGYGLKATAGTGYVFTSEPNEFVDTKLILNNSSVQEVVLGEGSTLTVGGNNSIETLVFKNADITGKADTTGNAATLTVESADLGNNINLKGALTFEGDISDVTKVSVADNVTIKNSGTVKSEITLASDAQLTISRDDRGTWNGAVGNGAHIVGDGKLVIETTNGTGTGYGSLDIAVSDFALSADCHGIYSNNGNTVKNISAGEITITAGYDAIHAESSNQTINVISTGDLNVTGGTAVRNAGANNTVNIKGQNVTLVGTAENVGGDNVQASVDTLGASAVTTIIAENALTIGDKTVNDKAPALNVTSTLELSGKTIAINGNITGEAHWGLGTETSGHIILQQGDMTIDGKVDQYKGTFTMNGGSLALNTTTGFFGGDVSVTSGTLTLGGVGPASGKTLTVGRNGTLAITETITNNGTMTLETGSTVAVLVGDAALSSSTVTLIGGEGTLNNDSELKENGIYDLSWVVEDNKKTGKISVKTKSAEQIVSDLKIDQQQAGTVAAILPTITAGSESAPAQLQAISKALRTAMEMTDSQTVSQIAEDLAPSTAPVVSSVSQGVNNAIAGVANARMAANRAAGDVFTGGSAWAQVIYNSADQDATKKNAKLESDTYGVALGIDGKVGDNLTIGAGFGVTKTDAESGTRDIDVDSYALFGYTEYNADNGWFVNGMVNAIRGRYEENKTPAGIKLTAKYQTTVLGAGVATGYHFENGISPEVGLRYLRTHQGSYNDGAQKIHTDGTNLLTASIGAKYEKAFEQGDWVLKPSARVAATYDVVSDDTESAIRVIGGGQYHVISAHQKRAAYEAGLGFEASNGDWDFSVAYNGEFRSHFKSHTGMIKAKYNF